MSRGPGKWQRAILDALQTQEQFYLWEILPKAPPDRPAHRPPLQMAVLRAAHGLAVQGQITLDTRRSWSNYVYWTGQRWQRLGGTIVARPGVTIRRLHLQIHYEVASRLQGRWPYLATPRTSAKLVPTLRPMDLGSVASLITLLVRQGHREPTDAQVITALSRWAMTPPIIQAALDQLRADGTYARLVDAALDLCALEATLEGPVPAP
jgi:hypothetical protein